MYIIIFSFANFFDSKNIVVSLLSIINVIFNYPKTVLLKLLTISVNRKRKIWLYPIIFGKLLTAEWSRTTENLE